YNKFAVFAMSSALLVPNASQLLEELVFFQHQPLTVRTICGKRPPFSAPHWTGDSAEGLVSVPLPAPNVLTADEAARLVRELGYDGRAAFASISRPTWMNAKPDRRRIGVVETDDGKWLGRTAIAQPIPYVAAAPGRRTKTGGGFTRDLVLMAVAKMRAS